MTEILPADEHELGIEQDVEQIRLERDEYLARWQRAAADYKNLRRRSLADGEERVRQALLPLLQNLLFVVDCFDMALAAPATTEESKNLATGVSLTRDQLLRTLEQDDVKLIPEGETFDPNLHEATGTVVREDVEPGTIVETTRRGYTWRETVLRHAHVIVAASEKEQGDPEGQEAVAAQEEGGSEPKETEPGSAEES
ncbi:MAG: nucleotide exchange factor GrpE [Planctomycetota bacterium]|nr:nucleotide exchange factor GrpE [Planctomycetota bacterium]